MAGKTGINKTRMSDLSNNPKTKLRVKELYLTALAIEAEPCELFKETCKDYKLPKNNYFKPYQNNTYFST